jgi:hypothetical protein
MGERTQVAGAATGPAKEALRERWRELQTLPAGLTRGELARWKRGRGYELERLLIELARLEKLDAAPAYRGKGEQIDGYFAVDHQRFLLETKWHELPAAASDVYAFQGKLRGKLLGTLGLFVSISHFAKETEWALGYGKEINVLLADGRDIEIAFDPARSLTEMVRVKMRAATQRGDVYYAYQRWLDANP